MDPNPTRAAADPAASPLSTAGGDTNPHPATGDSYSFLSPAEQPDELGRLGSYRVLAVIGRGGMGVVFRAEDPTLQRQVALKVMLPGADADARAKGRFLREARAQAKVEHEHVAVIHAVGEVGDVPFIAMPLLKGMPLSRALRLSPKVPLGELLRIGREIADGLSAAHAVGLVHRDIKPANVWLDGSNRRVRILDFGLARTEVTPDDAPAAEPGANAAVPSDALLTARGAVVGTPAFMSPEQAKGGHIDHRSDLFSLGVLLYEMATGKLPFTGRNSLEVLVAVASHHPPAAHEANPELPIPLSELIWRLMSKDAGERPATAADVVAELDALEGSLSVSRVQVVALPSVIQTAAEPGVWAELTTSGEPAAVDEEPADDEETEYVAPSERAGGGVPRWVWAVAGVCVLCAVGVGVWLAMPKPKPVAEKPPEGPVPAVVPLPAVKPPKESPKNADRLAAEALNPHADLTLKLDGGTVQVKMGERLPGGEFVVTAIGLPGGNLPANFADGILLPAVASLGSLESLSDYGRGAPILTEDQIVRLTTFPCARTLTHLGVSFELIPRTFEALKLLPRLTGLACRASSVDDALLERLPELTGLKHLQLRHLGKSGKVTARGLAALAKMSISDLRLYYCQVIPEVVSVLPSMAMLAALNLGYNTFAAEDLRGLARSPQIREIGVGNSNATDAELKHLAEMSHLRGVNVSGTKVTEAGVRELAAALPRCKIVWDGGTIAPKPAAEAERKAAETLQPHFQSIMLRVNGKNVWVGPKDPLPAELFRLVHLSSAARVLPPDFVSAQFLPAIAGVQGVQNIAYSDHVAFTANDLSRLAATPTRTTLTQLVGRCRPDADSVAALKQFPQLSDLGVDAGGASDEDLNRLKELPTLRGMKVFRLGDAGSVSEQKWAAIAALPLQGLSLAIEAKLDRRGGELLAAMPALERLFLHGVPPDPMALNAFGKAGRLKYLLLNAGSRPSGPDGYAALAALGPETTLQVSDGAIDDNGFEPLTKLVSTRHLILKGTKLTEAGVKKLAAALPRCKIEWDGGTIEPK